MPVKYLLFALFLFGLALPGFSQDGQNVEAIRIAYLTRQLNLTPEEAQQFWPVYNQAQDELKALKKDRRTDLKDARQNFDTMSDAEVAQAVDDMVSIKQRELDLFMKYHQEYTKVLPIRKVAKLYKAESEFRQILLERIKERREGNGPGRMQYRGQGRMR